MKACHTFELKTPTNKQVSHILSHSIPTYSKIETSFKDDIMNYIQGDIRKLIFICNIHKKKPSLLNSNAIRNIFQVKIFNKDAKKNTWKLIQDKIPLEEHSIFMNETERTTVALLWHENIVNPLSQFPIHSTFPFYETILKNMCFADYIGRVTFQSQIWLFNEMGSLIKTFYNNKLFHEKYSTSIKKPIKLEEIEFTKVLTKYSTEYNNQIFLNSLCQKMNMDKKDCIAFFQELRIHFGETFLSSVDKMNYIEYHLGKEEIDSLDIKRIYRFLDKNVKKEETIILDIDIEQDDDSVYSFD
jgi:hypothetical protein